MRDRRCLPARHYPPKTREGWARLPTAACVSTFIDCWLMFQWLACGLLFVVRKWSATDGSRNERGICSGETARPDAVQRVK